MTGFRAEVDWQQAEVVTNLRQQEPTEGASASEKTEVRILFDDKNLYVGVCDFDSEVARINARELIRDASFSNDDKVEILLDTYHAVATHSVSRSILRECSRTRSPRMKGADVNLSWDTSLISESSRDAEGWTVEIAIPLTSLPFKEGSDVWGFNVARIIRRKNEEALGTSWQREFGLERVSQAGELDGIGEINRRRFYQIKLYVTGGRL